MEYFEKVFVINEEVEDKRRNGNIYINFGDVYYVFG